MRHQNSHHKNNCKMPPPPLLASVPLAVTVFPLKQSPGIGLLTGTRSCKQDRLCWGVEGLQASPASK